LKGAILYTEYGYERCGLNVQIAVRKSISAWVVGGIVILTVCIAVIRTGVLHGWLVLNVMEFYLYGILVTMKTGECRNCGSQLGFDKSRYAWVHKGDGFQYDHCRVYPKILPKGVLLTFYWKEVGDIEWDLGRGSLDEKFRTLATMPKYKL
jgi:hypothetical protein